MSRIVKKPEERRREILRAARVLFQTKDYEQTTMQDVMKSVGIAKGTIYHYFKSKQELLEAVIEEMVEESLEGMREILEKESGNALQKIQKLMERGRLSEEQPELLEHLHKPGNEAMHVRLLSLAITKQAPLYAELIEEGCREGIFCVENPLEIVEFILTAIQFLTDKGIHPWTDEELKRRWRAFPGILERQLGAEKGTFYFMLELTE